MMVTPRAVAWWVLCALCAAIPACLGPPLEIEPAELPDGIEGEPYEQVLTGGGTPPEEWGIADGNPPPGLLLNASEGIIAGVPTAAGTYTFSLALRDSSFPRRTGEQIYSLTIIPGLELAVDLEPARVNVPYSATPEASGGVEPYTFDVVGLPAGLTFDVATGMISGTPLGPSAGLWLETSVTDNSIPPQTATETATLVIKAPVVRITTTELPAGTVGESYSGELTATNGLPPYSWSVVAGVLPDGLRLHRVTGVIYGTPTTAQTSTFTIEVQDSDEPPTTDSLEFTIEVSE